MKDLLHYETGPYRSSRFKGIERFLIWASGGDPQILEACSHSDRVKLLCLGGIVLATGILAALAGGFAIYTVFGPGVSLDGTPSPVSRPVMLCAIVFGVFWGLIILNLDRFILSATGKGDGTEKITLQEWKSAAPRLILASLIALTIAAPLEIRVLQSEINAELRLRQAAYLDSLRISVDGRHAGGIARLESEVARIEASRARASVQVEELRTRYLTETQRTDRRGVGPIAQAIKEEQIAMERKEADYVAQRDDMQSRLDAALQERETERASLVPLAGTYQGLAERITIAHSKYGVISWCIMLLILGLEITPILFKLMMVRSPYDYLEEHVHRVVKARQGIEFRPEYYKEAGTEGSHIDFARYYVAENAIEEKRKMLSEQEKLTGQIIHQWGQRESKKIDDDPDSYIDDSLITRL